VEEGKNVSSARERLSGEQRGLKKPKATKQGNPGKRVRGRGEVMKFSKRGEAHSLLPRGEKQKREVPQKQTLKRIGDRMVWSQKERLQARSKTPRWGGKSKTKTWD